jgi:hypothetical protein
VVTRSGEEDVEELSVQAVGEIVSRSKGAQERLRSIPIDDRLMVIGQMGEIWQRKMKEGRLEGIKDGLSKSTGYSKALLDLELSFVMSVLDPENMMRNIDRSLPGGTASLEGFSEISDDEFYLNVPIGPVMIISSGNSIVPTLIPTVLSWVAGNMTFLKPSISNFEGVVEVLNCIEEVPPSEAQVAMMDALIVSYLSHSSPALEEILARSSFGAINFWGGEPARTAIAMKVASNPNHPRFFANGPMTGAAIISKETADVSAAKGLAANVVLYDQQLCSSPTVAFFIGGHDDSVMFGKMLSEQLDAVGSGHPSAIREGNMFVLQNARRMLQLKGSTVLQGKTPENQWTIVLSKGRSMLDDMVVQFPSMDLYGRRRFIEIVSVASYGEAMKLIEDLPSTRAFKGIDRVQTIGLAVPSAQEDEVAGMASRTGAYRIVPVGDMFMRSALEPYDGISLASLFVQTSYRRTSSLWKGSIG